MKITKDMLFERYKRRNYDRKGVLTKEEASIRSNESYDIITIENDDYFFFSDDHCFGVNVLPEQWCPCTVSFPLHVTPRDSVPDGIVCTIEQFLSVFNKHQIQINSVDELIDIINKGE